MSFRFERGSFDNIVYGLHHNLVNRSVIVDSGEWQSIDISDRPEMVTHELFDVTVKLPIPDLVDDQISVIQPNMPWAEDHFQERVSGQPLNPPPSHEWWPFNKQNEIFQKDKKFSHTYPERFWPKDAGKYEGDENCYSLPDGECVGVGCMHDPRPNRGIRYEYGDLWNVVQLLKRSPLTRQAFLPVWFPEDTGAHHGERVPCSLGYHFVVRQGRLNCVYYMRSCDFLRHFRDDVYMAARLALWVRDQVSTLPKDQQLKMGDLTMHISSLHVFAGDIPAMRSKLDEAN